ncbi:MAG: nucleotidyltransferase domain-containing protein [Candidatus Eremiobacteraeota bacterium]|nr:nucleotidyltransferase domain-containing protein [Candidatus Eremiobacteraeota bacterium]MBC5802904.1 nucleotidyltransferase domain-containing protein [Candidatus Eremiobacteraeota bacterium]MBC5821155.1 nucleotidyltransferase domain-containing protein [Candidatus Eremiobacteraeota bacterium]
MAREFGGWEPLAYAERCRRRRAELTRRLDDFVAYCRAKPDIAVVVVFGSYARNRISPWSDLDVLVVRDAAPDARRLDLVDDLYRESRLGSDIIAVPTSRFPEGLKATPFGRDILSDGMTVYARPAR